MICHHPPWFNGASPRPAPGGGGSSASQNNWRTNWIGSQFTEASMFMPMMTKAMAPNMSDMVPSTPR